jgi:hypothetical protein
LIELTSNCDAFQQAQLLIGLNATGMIAYDDAGGLPQLNCANDQECNVSLYGERFFAFTVEKNVALDLKV